MPLPLPLYPGTAESCPPILGVPRAVLVAHAMEQLPPPLRGAVAAIEVFECGATPHMGIEVDRVAWRATWSRAGMPEATGSFAVWNGEPV